jgi:eukaryotic-like serine/threonine-protein kinase
VTSGVRTQPVGGLLPMRARPGVTQLPPLDEERFEVGGEHARGGLGLVFEALDRLFGRRVALKQPQQDRPDGVARFVREALITARLQHPAIVPIYDAGLRASGEPCFAMRLVPGATLQDAIAGARSLEERLALLPHVQDVANAVAYAHGEGILHRDLKPSNVLVGPFGETVVIDWGLAKDLRADGEDVMASSLREHDDLAPGLTRTGSILGTPGYMPPEQARGDEVDERADVHAIGAILYHLLAGQPPAVPASAVQEREPRAPVDLTAIVAKAMAVDPGRRYPTARELSHDLKRFATGNLVGARQYSTWELLRRSIHRHRATALVGLGLLAALVAGAVGVVRERNRTALENNRLRLMQAQAVLARDPTAAAAWLKTYRVEPGQQQRAVEVAARAEAAGVARHVLALTDDTPARVCLASSGALAGVLGRDGAMWLFDLRRGTGRQVGALGEPPGSCLFTDDERRFVAAATRRPVLVTVELPGGEARPVALPGQGVVAILPAAGGKLVVRMADGGLNLVAFDGSSPRPLPFPEGVPDQVIRAPDGLSLWATSGGGALWRIPLDGQSPTRLERFERPIKNLAVSGDGRQLAWTDGEEVVLRSLATGQTWRHPTRSESPFPPRLVTPAGDGLLFMPSDLAHVNFWDPISDEVVTLGRQVHPRILEVARDGRRAAWIDLGGNIYVVDLPGGRVRALAGHQTVRAAVMTPDGHWLATAHGNTVRIFPLGSTIATIVRIDSRNVRPIVVPPHFNALVRTAGPRGVVAVESKQALVLLDAGSGSRRRLADLGEPVSALAISPSGRRAAALGARGRGLVVDLDTGTVHELQSPPQIGQRLAFVGEERVAGVQIDTKHGQELHLWDIASGARRTLPVRLSPNDHSHYLLGQPGRLLASSATEVLLIDLDPFRVTPLHALGGSVNRLALSRDGRQAAAGLGDGRLLLWDLDRPGRRARPLGRRDGTVTGLLFTADASALMVADETGIIARVDVASGAAREIGRHAARIFDMDASPAGRWLASSDMGGEIRLWDLTTSGLAVLSSHGERMSLEFSGEDRIVSDGTDAWIQITTLNPAAAAPAAPHALAGWLDRLTTARVDADGQPLTLRAR